MGTDGKANSVLRRQHLRRRGLARRLLARLLRRRTPAYSGAYRGGDDPFDGGAGVREPRRPRPSGPRASGGARPVPEPSESITLPDSRQ